MPLRCLNKPGDIPICVFDQGNQLAPTDILNLLLCLCASVEEQLQTTPNVGHRPVADRPCHALGVAMGI